MFRLPQLSVFNSTSTGGTWITAQSPTDSMWRNTTLVYRSDITNIRGLIVHSSSTIETDSAWRGFAVVNGFAFLRLNFFRNFLGSKRTLEKSTDTPQSGHDFTSFVTALSHHSTAIGQPQLVNVPIISYGWLDNSRRVYGLAAALPSRCICTIINQTGSSAHHNLFNVNGRPSKTPVLIVAPYEDREAERYNVPIGSPWQYSSGTVTSLTGPSASFTVSSVDSLGSIRSVTVNSNGSTGYSGEPLIKVSSATSTQSAYLVGESQTSGALTRVRVEDGGYGFSVGQVLTVESTWISPGSIFPPGANASTDHNPALVTWTDPAGGDGNIGVTLNSTTTTKYANLFSRYRSFRNQGSNACFISIRGLHRDRGNIAQLFLRWAQDICNLRYPQSLYPTSSTAPELLDIPPGETYGYSVSHGTVDYNVQPPTFTSPFSVNTAVVSSLSTPTDTGWVPNLATAQLLAAAVNYPLIPSIMSSSGSIVETIADSGPNQLTTTSSSTLTVPSTGQINVPYNILAGHPAGVFGSSGSMVYGFCPGSSVNHSSFFYGDISNWISGTAAMTVNIRGAGRGVTSGVAPLNFNHTGNWEFNIVTSSGSSYPYSLSSTNITTTGVLSTLSLTIPAGLPGITAGKFVTIQSGSSVIAGTVVSYSSLIGLLNINVFHTWGSGTYSNWTVRFGRWSSYQKLLRWKRPGSSNNTDGYNDGGGYTFSSGNHTNLLLEVDPLVDASNGWTKIRVYQNGVLTRTFLPGDLLIFTVKNQARDTVSLVAEIDHTVPYVGTTMSPAISLTHS